jgi:sugar lactone lactonase YvrE
MTRVLDAEVAVQAQCQLGEGPVWDMGRGLLWWVDILAGHVHAIDPGNSGRVDLFDTDPDTGALGSRHPFVTVPETDGIPDGLTLDAEGCVWLAVWDSGEVRRFTPDGRLDTVVRLPARQVTSAAFGGPDLGTLYITTAWEGLTAADLAEQPHAGDIFACTPGVTGRPPFLFAA